MTRSDTTRGQLSTYSFPEEIRVDELLVRAPRDEDVEEIAPAFTDPAVGGEAGLPPFDAEAIRLALKETLPEMRARGVLAVYVIEDTRDRSLLGGMALHHFDPMRDAVEVGYWLFVASRGRGVVTRCVRGVADHAFANGLCRVEAHVRLENKPSERVLERLGFEREGIRRRYLRHGNIRADATLFTLLADDA
jgi:RimJ/RimL family protein N-acetyltransferase